VDELTAVKYGERMAGLISQGVSGRLPVKLTHAGNTGHALAIRRSHLVGLLPLIRLYSLVPYFNANVGPIAKQTVHPAAGGDYLTHP
jgi:hypothetical protein